ncbi:hypothetical protein BkAM31D_12415 [Halalkalibacter krulwichiae]|uniref:Uncharacterized protein n=1 Tax=Halalkalibacter krulwichiae TaxID=199441 RepID=A0A1X9MAW2_9BACI|nr:hypothetical protein BkAM31D_12415 [Halalkalibacter krulwichiae]
MTFSQKSINKVGMLDEALARIDNGCTLMFGGFGGLVIHRH